MQRGKTKRAWSVGRRRTDTELTPFGVLDFPPLCLQSWCMRTDDTVVYPVVIRRGHRLTDIGVQAAGMNIGPLVSGHRLPAGPRGMARKNTSIRSGSGSSHPRYTADHLGARRYR